MTQEPTAPDLRDQMAMAALTVADVLNRAADLIEPEGAWMQDNYTRNLQSFCPLGAIAHVAGVGCTHASQHPASFALSRYLDPSDPSPGRVVARWNDAPERTQAEVVAALRQAAADAMLAQRALGTPNTPEQSK